MMPVWRRDKSVELGTADPQLLAEKGDVGLELERIVKRLFKLGHCVLAAHLARNDHAGKMRQPLVVTEFRRQVVILEELGEKLPEEDKTKIEACCEQLKKSIETDEVDAIKSDIEALTQASHKMAEILYSQQAEQQGGQAGDGSGDTPESEEKSGKEDDDIVDADFEEVKK